jgi:hypothetical protein
MWIDGKLKRCLLGDEGGVGEATDTQPLDDTNPELSFLVGPYCSVYGQGVDWEVRSDPPLQEGLFWGKDIRMAEVEVPCDT